MAVRQHVYYGYVCVSVLSKELLILIVQETEISQTQFKLNQKLVGK